MEGSLRVKIKKNTCSYSEKGECLGTKALAGGTAFFRRKKQKHILYQGADASQAEGAPGQYSKESEDAILTSQKRNNQWAEENFCGTRHMN